MTAKSFLVTNRQTKLHTHQAFKLHTFLRSISNFSIDTRGRIDAKNSNAMHDGDLCNNTNDKHSTVNKNIDRLIVSNVT